jgi:hypothetical protein
MRKLNTFHTFSASIQTQSATFKIPCGTEEGFTKAGNYKETLKYISIKVPGQNLTNPHLALEALAKLPFVAVKFPSDTIGGGKFGFDKPVMRGLRAACLLAYHLSINLPNVEDEVMELELMQAGVRVNIDADDTIDAEAEAANA